MTNGKLANPVGELGVILSGDSLERLAGLMLDPDADLSPGQLARLGQAFSEIGGGCIAAAKDAMEPRIAGGAASSRIATDAGVTFEWRPPSESHTLKTAAIKALYSRDERPELYRVSQRRASISLKFADLG